MAADLFETYAVTAVATMVLASIFFAGTPNLVTMMLLPLAIGGACIVTSIIGTFFVKLGANDSIMGALYKGLIVTGVLSLVGIAWRSIGCSVSACRFAPRRRDLHRHDAILVRHRRPVVTGLIVWITEYYTGTGYRPVRSIAQASVTGHGTNVIQGLAVSLDRPRCRRSSSSPAFSSPTRWPASSASPSR